MGGEIRGRTLGIVGLGHTGRELARLVAPVRHANSRVLAARRPRRRPSALGVRLTSLEELLRESDFISLHCRLTEATRGLIGAAQLALMKPTAYFINVGRGELVDQRALTEALRERRIAGAGLDVFAVEPLPAGRPAAGAGQRDPHAALVGVDRGRLAGDRGRDGRGHAPRSTGSRARERGQPRSRGATLVPRETGTVSRECLRSISCRASLGRDHSFA